jgi:hypothetical protein
MTPMVTPCSTASCELASAAEVESGVALAPRPDVSTTRASAYHYGPGWVAGLWLAVGMLALLFVGACLQRTPVAPNATPTRTSRPHGPAYRVDNGLGSPIARLRQGYGEASSV